MSNVYTPQTLPPAREFTGRRGVTYKATNDSQGPKFDALGKVRNGGLTIRRISARPVDIKRRERALKKAGMR